MVLNWENQPQPYSNLFWHIMVYQPITVRKIDPESIILNQGGHGFEKKAIKHNQYILGMESLS